MSNEYSREEQNALKTGLYVTLALIALSLFYVSGRKAVEHQESGSYYPVYARFGRTDGLQVGDVVRQGDGGQTRRQVQRHFDA